VRTIYPHERREFVHRGEPPHREGGRRVGFGRGEFVGRSFACGQYEYGGTITVLCPRGATGHGLPFVVRVVLQGDMWVFHVLDSRGDHVCTIVPEGQIFRADFSQCVGSSLCLVAGVSTELWKWHRRPGHFCFDLLSCLSGLGLVRGLPKLKYQEDLVCAPCRHGKMVAASHPPLTSVMTKRPCELFHMDLVGPTRVGSVGEKWYVLVIVMTILSMLGSSFWLTRGGGDVWFCEGSNVEVEE
jgi:hypothetical protein